MQKWEYKITGKLNDSEINALGAQGWELVAITDYYGIALYFKRPIS